MGIRERSVGHLPQNEDCRMKRSVSSRRSRDWENAKPSSMDAETFCECITDESYVWTDGLRSYVKPLKEKNCSNKVLESYQEYDAVNHLNNVNSFHSQIQEQYRVYRGVSSKYINRYNALFMLQREYMGMDSQEILLLIMKRLRKRGCYFFHTPDTEGRSI